MKDQNQPDARTRRDCYALITNLLLKQPEKGRFPGLARELCSLLEALGESSGGLTALMSREGFVKETEQEYYDVFFVPKSGHYVPPYASSLMSYTPLKKKPFGLLDPGVSARVKGYYDRCGFDPQKLDIFSPWRQAGAADHVGFCFALMANLCDAQHREKEPEAAENWRALQARFLREELLPCLPNFETALAQADAPFYSALGHAAHLWAQYDAAGLNDLGQQ